MELARWNGLNVVRRHGPVLSEVQVCCRDHIFGSLTGILNGRLERIVANANLQARASQGLDAPAELLTGLLKVHGIPICTVQQRTFQWTDYIYSLCM